MRVSACHNGFSLCLCLMVAGCVTAGEAARQVGKNLPAPAISESLKAFNEPENQRLLANLLTMPAVRDAATMTPSRDARRCRNGSSPTSQ